MTAAAIGLTFAVGFMLIIQVIAPRRISLADSIAPYVGSPPQARVGGLHNVIASVRTKLVSEPVALWATDQSIAAWLRQSENVNSIASFRRSQIIAAGTSLGVATVWLILRQVSGQGMGPTGCLLIMGAAFIFGGWLRQWQLHEKAKSRVNSIERQLPAILDLMAFAVAAGEPVLLAMRRISSSCNGPLVDELRRMVHTVNSGEGLVLALDQLQADLGSDAVTRATHALSLALERGTPLAQVLRAQATDARAHEVRMLLVLAGKKETAMMLPVVFLILPMIVAVALYPGLIALQVM